MKKPLAPDAERAVFDGMRGALRRPPEGPSRISALAELLGAASTAQTHLLTFDFAGVARDEAGVRENGLEARIVVDERTGDAVTDGAGLAGLAAAGNVHHDVERFDVFRELQGLHDDHAAGFTLEVLVERAAVDHDLARAALDEDAGDGALATAGAVIVVADHLFKPLSEVKDLGLLSRVRVFGAGVDLELLDHGVAERTLRKHALHRDFKGAARVLRLHFRKRRFVDAAGVARVAVVRLLRRLFGGEDELVGMFDLGTVGMLYLSEAEKK